MSRVVDRQERPSGVAVVERAVLLQQLVAAADAPLSLRELARRAGLAPTTAKRLASTLEDLALLQRDAQGRYQVGAAAQTLTGAPLPSASPNASLGIVLRRVVDEFDESATVSIDTGTEVLYAGCRPSAQDVTVPDMTGGTAPFHLIASGVVLMTAWSDARLDRYLDGPLDSATPASVTDPAVIRRRVRDAGEHGYAWSVGESIADITALAVPVHDRHGELLASIGIYGPSFRIDSDDTQFAQELRELVASTSSALGL